MITRGELYERRNNDLFYDISDDELDNIAEAQTYREKYDEFVISEYMRKYHE